MAKHELRKTPYADEITEPAQIAFPDGSEGRFERLKFKTGHSKGNEGYRFSWWKDGRILPRPLDVTEDEFLELMRKALQEEVLSQHALRELRTMLNTGGLE